MIKSQIDHLSFHHDPLQLKCSSLFLEKNNIFHLMPITL
jgi:hypothetical protein